MSTGRKNLTCGWKVTPTSAVPAIGIDSEMVNGMSCGSTTSSDNSLLLPARSIAVIVSVCAPAASLERSNGWSKAPLSSKLTGIAVPPSKA